MRRWPWIAAVGVAAIVGFWMVGINGPSQATLGRLIEVNFVGIADVRVMQQQHTADGRTKISGTALLTQATYSKVRKSGLASLCGGAGMVVPQGSVVAEVLLTQDSALTFEVLASVHREWIGDHLEVNGWLFGEPVDGVFSHEGKPLGGYTFDALDNHGSPIILGTDEAQALCVGQLD